MHRDTQPCTCKCSTPHAHPVLTQRPGDMCLPASCEPTSTGLKAQALVKVSGTSHAYIHCESPSFARRRLAVRLQSP
eukprot:6861386-Prymnesium_polylepis.1